MLNPETEGFFALRTNKKVKEFERNVPDQRFIVLEQFLGEEKEKTKRIRFGEARVWKCKYSIEIAITENDGRIWRFSVFKERPKENPQFHYFSWCDNKEQEKSGIDYSLEDVIAGFKT